MYKRNSRTTQNSNSVSTILKKIALNDGTKVNVDVSDKILLETIRNFPGFYDRHPDFGASRDVLTYTKKAFPCNALVIQANNFFRNYEIMHECTLVISPDRLKNYLMTKNVATEISLLHHAYHCAKVANYEFVNREYRPTSRKDLIWKTFLDTTCTYAIEAALTEGSDENGFPLVQFKNLKPFTPVYMSTPISKTSDGDLCIMVNSEVDNHFRSKISVHPFMKQYEEICLSFTHGENHNMSFVLSNLHILTDRLFPNSYSDGAIIRTIMKKSDEVVRKVILSVIKYHDLRVSYLKYLDPKIAEDVRVRFYANEYKDAFKNPVDVTPLKSYIELEKDIKENPSLVAGLPILPPNISWRYDQTNPNWHLISHLEPIQSGDGTVTVGIPERDAYEVVRVIQRAYFERDLYQTDSKDPGTEFEELITSAPPIEDSLEILKSTQPYTWLTTVLLLKLEPSDEAKRIVRSLLHLIVKLAPPSEYSIEEIIAMFPITPHSYAQKAKFQLATGAINLKMLPEFGITARPEMFEKAIYAAMCEISAQNIDIIYQAIENPRMTDFATTMGIFRTKFGAVEALFGKQIDAKTYYKVAEQIMLTNRRNKCFAFFVCLIKHYSDHEENDIVKACELASAKLFTARYNDFNVKHVSSLFMVGFPLCYLESCFHAVFKPEDLSLTAEDFIKAM